LVTSFNFLNGHEQQDNTPQEDQNVDLCDKPLREDKMGMIRDGGEKARNQGYPAPQAEVSVRHLPSPDHLNPCGTHHS